VVNNEDELAKVKLNIIRCYEEESGKINRTNKSREIEKEFKEKKVTEVLLSNKETKRAAKETNKASCLLIFSIIMMAIYVGAPLTLACTSYYSASESYDLIWKMSKYSSYVYKYANECTEVYNTLLVLSLYNA
jgi:hypothetical protein